MDGKTDTIVSSVSTTTVETPKSDQVNNNLNVWKKRFEKKSISDDPVIAKLDGEYNELAQTWKKFQQDLPLQDRVEFEERSQNAGDVVALVRGVQTGWMTGCQRQPVFDCCVTLGDQLISTVDSHAVLLAALSESEIYISLVYGVLQSLIKASVNYPRIVEGLLRVLVEINEGASVVANENPDFYVDDNILHISSFYSLIFFALGGCLDWYIKISACRLLNSPNQDAYYDLQAFVENVRDSARDVARKVADGMDLDGQENEGNMKFCQQTSLYHLEKTQWKEIGLQGHTRRLAAQHTWIRQFIWDIQRDIARRTKFEEERDMLLSNLFVSVSHKLRAVSKQSSGIASLKAETAVPPAVEDLGPSKEILETQQGTRRKLTKVSIQLGSKHFEDFFDNEDQLSDIEPNVEMSTEGNVSRSFQEWATTPHSQVLVVGQRQSTTFPSPVGLISACYAYFARQARLPIVSHFCSPRRQARKGKVHFEEDLVALAYSLLRQFVDLLPPVVDCDVENTMNSDHLDRLRGTLTSWKEVLSSIDTILHYMPPILICVIEGLDVIYDSSTDEHIRSLLRVLFRHTRYPEMVSTFDGSKKSVLYKVLITVSGRPDWMMETLAENQAPSNGTGQRARLDQVLASDVWAVTMST